MHWLGSSSIVVPADVVDDYIVPFPSEADLESAASDAAPKSEADQRALRVMRLNQRLGENPFSRPGDETGAHVKLLLVAHEHDAKSHREADRDAVAKQKKFTCIQEVRLIAAYELSGKTTKEAEDLICKAFEDPSGSRLRARRAAVKKFTNFRDVTDFKNHVKTSLCSAKDSGTIDQIIAEIEWSLCAQRDIIDRAGRFRKFLNWLNRFVRRRNKFDPDAIRAGMLPPRRNGQKFTPSIESLLTMSIWTQVNQAHHYPDFQIYSNLFEVAVYFSRALEGSSPEMTAGTAETLVDRMAIGAHGQSDHLTPKYLRVFDLVDEATFDIIFDRAVSYVDAQGSRSQPAR